MVVKTVSVTHVTPLLQLIKLALCKTSRLCPEYYPRQRADIMRDEEKVRYSAI